MKNADRPHLAIISCRGAIETSLIPKSVSSQPTEPNVKQISIQVVAMSRPDSFPWGDRDEG